MVLVTCLFPPRADDSAYDNARNLEVALSVNADRAVLGIAANRLELDAAVPVPTVIPLERNFVSDSLLPLHPRFWGSPPSRNATTSPDLNPTHSLPS